MNEIIFVKVLLSLVAIVGIWLAGRTKGIFHKIITVFLASAIFITWQRTPEVLFLSILVQIVAAVFTLFYGIFVKGLNISERFCITTMGLMVSSGMFFRIQHLPCATIISLSLIIPLTAFLVNLAITRKFVSKEMSFMFIWATLASIQFFNNLIIIF